MAIAYLNGDWMAPDEARVSVFDRGFMFGDGVYEVMAVDGGGVFLLESHLARLQRSLDAIRLKSPHGPEAWASLILSAVDRAGEDPALLYLQVTRGPASPRAHAWPQDSSPTVLITVTRAPAPGTAPPCKVMTREDFRWGRGDIKTVSLIAASLMKNEAIAEGFDDAILIRNGEVTEATAANVFVVRDGEVATPPGSRRLLHGITRAHVLELVRQAGLPMAERAVPEAELQAADEVWITSTGQGICPVIQVNDRRIGDGAPGAVWRRVNELFRASRPDYCRTSV